MIISLNSTQAFIAVKARPFLRALLGLCIFFGPPSHAQVNTGSTPALFRKLDEYLVSAVSLYRFNGTVLVAKRGKVLLHKGYGWKNAAARTLNDTGTVFPILSITKSFTAMAVLKLQEQGKLSVNDPLDKYFPDYPEGRKITLRHLLTHTSGIYNYTNDIGKEDSAIVCYPVSRQRILDIFYNKPLEFKPGKRFSYNNSGYFLLGMIIEKVTGKPYEQVIREFIFDPLHMNRSGFDFIHLPDGSKARGYDLLSPEKLIPSNPWDSTVSYAAGSIYSTTGDMYKWGRAIANGQLLSAGSREQAFTPFRDRYGYGWWTGILFGQKYVNHTGGGFGFMSDFTWYPAEDVTIILLNNFGDYGQSLLPLVTTLSAIVFNQPYDLWKTRTTVKVDETRLEKYTGTYTLDGKAKLFITLDNGQLYAEGNSPSSIPRLPIYAEAENIFFLKDFNVTFAFVTGRDGNVPKLIIHEKGGDFEWTRIK